MLIALIIAIATLFAFYNFFFLNLHKKLFIHALFVARTNPKVLEILVTPMGSKQQITLKEAIDKRVKIFNLYETFEEIKKYDF